MYAGYEIQNIGDHYINGGYEQCTGPGTTYCPDSFTSFRGVATLRTTELRIQRHTDPDFQFLDCSFGITRTFRFRCPDFSPFPANNILGRNRLLFVVVGTAAV